MPTFQNMKTMDCCRPIGEVIIIDEKTEIPQIGQNCKNDKNVQNSPKMAKGWKMVKKA
jgi:hypothetical protein